jgi:site-specific DNA recombinase
VAGQRLTPRPSQVGDYLDKVVWDHITDLLANPTLIDRRLDQLRTADPTTAQQNRLQQALAKASTSITRLIKAYQEELISLDPGLGSSQVTVCKAEVTALT